MQIHLPSGNIGLSIQDTRIVVAKAYRKKNEISLEKQGEVSLPKEVVVDGVVHDSEELAKHIAKAVSVCGNNAHARVTLCIPSHHIYTAWLENVELDVLGSPPQEKITGLFPEPTEELMIQTHLLTGTAKNATVAISGVRKDIVSGYQDACTQANVVLGGITSDAYALASSANKQRSHLGEVSLLVYSPEKETAGASVTVLYDGWPIDESVLFGTPSETSITAAVEKLLREYESLMPITAVSIVGSKKLLESTKKLCDALYAERSAATEADYTAQQAQKDEQTNPKGKKKDDTAEKEKEKNTKKNAKDAEKNEPTKKDLEAERKAYIEKNTAPLGVEASPIWTGQQQRYAGAACASVRRNSGFNMLNTKRPVTKKKQKIIVVMASLFLLAGGWYTTKSYLGGAPVVVKEEVDTVHAAPPIRPPLFADVPGEHPDYDAIAWSQEQNILVPAGDTFEPDAMVDRATFLVILVDLTASVDIESIQQKSGITDIDDRPELIPYTRYARVENIIGENPLLRPNDTIVLVEALKMVYEAYNVEGVSATEEGEAWFVPYLNHAIVNGILSEEHAAPDAPLTKAKMVSLLRQIGRFQSKAAETPQQ